MSQKPKVAILTAGGLAPCLSSAVGGLIERYSELAPEVEIIGYLGGYKGLLLGQSVQVTPDQVEGEVARAQLLLRRIDRPARHHHQPRIQLPGRRERAVDDRLLVLVVE